jgi:hypothetical protein
MKAHSENNAQAAIFRWTDEGWQQLAGGLPQPINHMPYALLTDPEAPGRCASAWVVRSGRLRQGSP